MIVKYMMVKDTAKSLQTHQIWQLGQRPWLWLRRFTYKPFQHQFQCKLQLDFQNKARRPMLCIERHITTFAMLLT